MLYEKNSGTSAPCASLTKMMTALVFLEQQPDFNRTVEVTQTELSGRRHTQLRRGEQVRLGDLLHMSLMCSDNVATRVLVRESGMPLEDFLARMNRQGGRAGPRRGTRFVECTGLDERNVSTAADIARLLHAAADNPTIHDITTQRGYDFLSFSASDRVRAHHIATTNRLLYGRYEILGGKTGFISESGYSPRHLDPHRPARHDRGGAGRAHQRHALRRRGAAWCSTPRMSAATARSLADVQVSGDRTRTPGRSSRRGVTGIAGGLFGVGGGLVLVPLLTGPSASTSTRRTAPRWP